MNITNNIFSNFIGRLFSYDLLRPPAPATRPRGDSQLNGVTACDSQVRLGTFGFYLLGRPEQYIFFVKFSFHDDSFCAVKYQSKHNFYSRVI